jgi:hypothetical protein
MTPADEAPARLGDFPVVFLSYDEPWADETFAALKALRPDALRVHGVKGLDASHKAAAAAARTEWFLTVDADTTLAASAFAAEVPLRCLQPVFRLDWPSRNAVNGLVSGNGCLKLWPRALVMAMRTHEAAPQATVSLDHDIGRIRPGRSRQVILPGCHATTDPARTPYHAFRAGFREVAFLADLHARHAGPAPAGSGRADRVSWLMRVWCSVGRHARNGDWVIYGARLALWMRSAWRGWDPRSVNDYGWFDRFWHDDILPRIGRGGSRCRLTGVTWDVDRLDHEIRALGQRIDAFAGLPLAEFDPAVSGLIADADLFPALGSGSVEDALGRVFEKGMGVAPDFAAARAHYETAAALGQVSALTNLGQLHDRGMIPDADPARARHYYEEATALGNRHAPWHLAALLEGTAPAEEVEALRDLAAERGFAPDPAAQEAAG